MNNNPFPDIEEIHSLFERVDDDLRDEHFGEVADAGRDLLAEVARLRHAAGECECVPSTMGPNGITGTLCAWLANS